MKAHMLSAVAVAAALTSAPAFAAAYMKYEGVPAAITAAPPTASARTKGGWIEIESYSFGTVGSRTCTGQGGPGVISAEAQRSALPPPSATRIPKMTLQVEKPGGGYLEVKLENVMISSATAAGAARDRPMESLSLNFTKVSWSHTNCTAGMLLPAVQKVREAASR